MSRMKYDLESRTLDFAKAVRKFLKTIPKNITNLDDIKQVVRSSGSVGANYIEANDGLSKKDFIYRIKISRKEAKETIYWLELILEDLHGEYKNEAIKLKKEAKELMNILSAIYRKSI